MLDSDASAATERSTRPVSMTSVCPVAKISSTAELAARFWRLIRVRKAGFEISDAPGDRGQSDQRGERLGYSLAVDP